MKFTVNMKKKMMLLAATVVVLLGCSIETNAKGKTNSLIKYLPKGCRVIGSLNVAKMLKQEFIKGKMSESKEATDLLKKYGVSADCVKNLSFGIVTKKNFTETPYYTLLVKTKTDKDADKLISALVKEKKCATQNIAGHKVFVDASNPEVVFCTKLKRSIIAFTNSQNTMTSVLGISKKKTKGIPANAPIMKLAKKGKSSADIWVAVLLPEAARKELPQMASSIESGLIELFLTKKNHRLLGCLNCKNKASAQMLVGVMNLFAGQIGMNPQFGLRPENIKITNAEAQVKIDLKIPNSTLDNLTKGKGKPL